MNDPESPRLCPICDGRGHIAVRAYGPTPYRIAMCRHCDGAGRLDPETPSEDPPYALCLTCAGSGEVSLERAYLGTPGSVTAQRDRQNCWVCQGEGWLTFTAGRS